MKRYLKKFGIMFVMALILSLGFCISAFADDTSQSVKINNTTLSFNKIIYVDGTNGNDTTGNGSTENPYQSITKAQSVALDGNAIYIRKGTYNLSSTGNGLSENKHKLTFIGEPNGTIIVSDGTKNSARDSHAAAFEVDCSVYNIIFKYTVGNRSTNYSSALVGDGNMSTQQYGNFHNCVFIATDKAPAPCYGNRDINVKFNNCSFIIPNNFQSTYIEYGSDRTQWLNCAESKNAYKTATTCLGNLSFSTTDYNIISNGWKNTGTGTNPDGTQANIGVYGGEFAWGNWDNKSISLDKSTMNLNVGDSGQLTATTTPAGAQVIWSSSDSTIATVDSNGRVTASKDKEGTCTITATTTDGSNLSATCIVTVTNSTNPNPTPNQGTDTIVNIAHAKGDNTNNGGGDVTIIFHGTADTTLSVVKTADVKDVWVGDNFSYTIVVTNTGTKTAKAVVVNDPAPNHIDFVVNGITTTQGTVDSSSTSKNIIVNVGDIPPSGTVTITVPATVVL